MISLHLITHGSPEYDQMIGLRMELLRKPLGLTFTEEQLANEKNDLLIGAFEKEEIVGCCVLTHHHEGVIQLRQMAVKKELQSEGVGKKIVEYAEKLAQKKGYTLLMMHARDVALGFYQKCGYVIKGHGFTEVTVPHHYMEKKLRPA